ncbi:MAG TPA: LPXTG cell wall anchor domain-containing protein [Acidimicrobiales bacterium]|nr:LPXTG cell wall anchor domain-containing protein [Acidimicrobiales bacterium]
MGRIRGAAALAAAAAVAGTFVAGPASAQTARPESYVGSAAGSALDLSVLSLPKLSLGVSTAKATSLPTAVAEGTGALGIAGTTAHAEVASGGSDVKPQTCAVPVGVAGILDVGLACGTASASIASGNPSATSEGSVASVDIAGQNLLNSVAPITDAVTGTVGGALTTLCGALSLTCPVTGTVSDVLNSVVSTDTLQVAAGTSKSSVVAAAGTVTATATSQGAEIKLLPLPQVGGVTSGEPLATITVGTATATAVYNRATGVATPTVDPALVTVKLNTLLTNALGVGQTITVPVGTSLIVPGTEGTPLETEIVAAAGHTTTNPDGTVTAVSDAVKIHALKGISGGILLDLAHAEAGVGGTVAVAGPPPAELPHTGGTPWMPLAGSGLLGAAILVRRLRVRED